MLQSLKCLLQQGHSSLEACPSDLEILQVAKVQQMSAMRSRLERDFLDSLPGKSVLQLREHLTAKLAALREQAAAVISEHPAEEVRQPGLGSTEYIPIYQPSAILPMSTLSQSWLLCASRALQPRARSQMKRLLSFSQL